jgi:hypothetical protein
MLNDVERRYSQCEKEALAVVCRLREGANLPYQAIILTIVTIGQSSSQPDLWKRKFPSASKYRKAGTQTHAVRLLDSSQARQHEHSRLLLLEKSPRNLEEIASERYINYVVRSSLPPAVTVDEVAKATNTDEDLILLMLLTSTFRKR